MAPKQVVVVDDDHETRMLLEELLALEGYQVIPCARPELAYEIIRRVSPDLAIVDLMLGGPEEGWLILTLLRGDPATAHLPIILCSANVGFLRRRGPLLRRRGCVALENLLIGKTCWAQSGKRSRWSQRVSPVPRRSVKYSFSRGKASPYAESASSD